MEKIQSYRDLMVWQKSMDLVVEVYQQVKPFPKEELYCLTSQMKRSSISIPSNIAEGSRRSSRKEFRNFLLIAYGSGSELETQLEISKRLQFTNNDQHTVLMDKLNEVMRMLNGLIKSLGNVE